MASIWSLFSLLSLLLLLDSLAYRQKPNSGRNYGYRSIKKSCIYNNPPNTKTDDSFEVKYDAEFIESLKKKRSYFSILTERLMQTIDDGQVSKKAKDISNLDLNQKREKLLVLGSGWGSYAFLKSVDPTMYDITVISPRNYFTFTPMLAASAVGTVEFRSICEPIRNISPLIKFIEASAMSIDPYKKSLLCQSIKCSGTVCEDFEFDVEYDKLLIAVGSVVNTFGIKGVRDNCQFLKQVEDAAKIRTSLSYCFERASIPNLSDEERKTALTFVIVGAGPTGVELIGELRDWMEIEGRRYFPQLLKYVEIVLVEAGNAVLAVFDNELQKEGLNKLTNRDTKLIQDGLIPKEMTRVLLGVGVKEVNEKSLQLSTGEQLPYGFCVWAAGVGPTPLVQDLVKAVPEQVEVLPLSRGRVATDGWLRVRGCDGLYCIGDCNFVENSPLPATAQVASQQGAYLGRLLSKGYRLGSYSATEPPYKIIIKPEESSTTESSSSNNSEKSTVFPSERLGFGRLGKQPPLASVSSSSSSSSSSNTFVNSDTSNASNDSTELTVAYAKPFQFLNLGVLAYVGASQALAQVSVNDKNLLGSGPLGFLLWRGIYWFKQVSWRNRVLIAVDWVKARFFGRDIGRI